MQESSHGESISTLGFGSRVSEITLGAAKRNTESGAIFEAKESARRIEQESERHAREVRKMRPSTCMTSLVQVAASRAGSDSQRIS